MKAVMVLNDFWSWSGGMAQYRAWANSDTIPYPPPVANGDWNTFQAYSAGFYNNKKANKIFQQFLKAVISRENSYTGKQYKDDPTIMSWELGNEPRGFTNIPAYQGWIKKTAKFIKSHDKNHLVSIGSEGNTANQFAGTNFGEDHKSKFIDYTTIHIWVQNWSWFDPKKGEEGLPEALKKAKAYLKEQLEVAKELNKPLVVEEFGIARDTGSFESASTTHIRDEYFRELFDYMYSLAKEEKVMAGANFWSWGGEGRPTVAGGAWSEGDDLIGDPPHEEQGWYSVYDSDSSTIAIIQKYATLFKQLNSTEEKEKVSENKN